MNLWKPYSQLPKEKGHKLKCILVAWKEEKIEILYWSEKYSMWTTLSGDNINEFVNPDWYMEIPSRPKIRKGFAISYVTYSKERRLSNKIFETLQEAQEKIKKENFAEEAVPIIIPLEWEE